MILLPAGRRSVLRCRDGHAERNGPARHFDVSLVQEVAQTAICAEAIRINPKGNHGLLRQDRIGELAKCRVRLQRLFDALAAVRRKRLCGPFRNGVVKVIAFRRCCAVHDRIDRYGNLDVIYDSWKDVIAPWYGSSMYTNWKRPVRGAPPIYFHLFSGSARGYGVSLSHIESELGARLCKIKVQQIKKMQEAAKPRTPVW